MSDTTSSAALLFSLQSAAREALAVDSALAVRLFGDRAFQPGAGAAVAESMLQGARRAVRDRWAVSSPADLARSVRRWLDRQAAQIAA